VKGKVKISLRVNFEAEDDEGKLSWFSVDNYVKLLCDHVRSIIAGMAKRHAIAEIKANYVDLVRDAILGIKPSAAAPIDSEVSTALTKRPGLGGFTNGMRVIEVEVLSLTLSDTTIANLLDQAQHQVVESNIRLEQARKDLEATKERERITREKLDAQHTTKQKELDLQEQTVGEELVVALAEFTAALQKVGEQQKQRAAEEELADIRAAAQRQREKASADQQLEIDTAVQKLELEKLTASTTAVTARFEAAKDGLHEALVALGRDDIAAKLAEACTIDRWLSGDNMASSIGNLLSMFPTLQEFVERASKPGGNGGASRLSSREASPAT